MVVKANDKITAEELETKKIYDEYKEIKLMLDYTRSSEAQKILRESKDSAFNLPKPSVKRKSRI